MRSVHLTQHLSYFREDQWLALSRATRTSFLEMIQTGVSAELLHASAAFLRTMGQPLRNTEVRFFIGANNLPQFQWVNESGHDVEVQISTDKIIWFIDGVADSVDQL